MSHGWDKMKLYKISEFAKMKNLCTAAIYKKINLGLKFDFDEKGEMVTSEEYFQEYLKNRKRGRPNKGEKK